MRSEPNGKWMWADSSLQGKSILKEFNSSVKSVGVNLRAQIKHTLQQQDTEISWTIWVVPFPRKHSSFLPQGTNDPETETEFHLEYLHISRYALKNFVVKYKFNYWIWWVCIITQSVVPVEVSLTIGYTDRFNESGLFMKKT